jgi:uncharacterized delta-60 repeat protein
MIYAADGDLDPAFGTGGLVSTDFGGSNDQALTAAVQPDGKIIAAGSSIAGGPPDFALARYNANGSLDTTFGTNGLVTTNFSGIAADVAFAVAVQPDGKIITAGSSSMVLTDFALVRYNANGSLDTTFGTDGFVTTNFGVSTNQVRAVVLQSDGKIIAVGVGSDEFALARYTTTGILDTTFGTNGTVTTNFGGIDQAFAAAIQPDGKIIAVGLSNVSGNNDFALARYNANGSLDTTFGTNGTVTTNVGGSDQANAVAIQPDGKIIAAGSANTNTAFALARYNTNGSLDTTFGTNGIVITSLSGGQARAIILQSDEKIIAVGTSNITGNNNFTLVRYNSNGSLDTTFGTNGIVTTNFGGTSNDQAFTAAKQPDGRIVVAGLSNVNGTNDFALARYQIPSVTISNLAEDIRAKYTLIPLP